MAKIVDIFNSMNNLLEVKSEVKKVNFERSSLSGVIGFIKESDSITPVLGFKIKRIDKSWFVTADCWFK